MNIAIVGCGKIGSTILASLVAEGHNVTAVDNNPDTITEITNIHDCMGICGNGADCDILEEIGAGNAEMFIAVTGSDELNMLSCYLAKKMGAKHTVARIRNPEYNDRSLDFMKQELGLSMAINPELLAAKELFNILKLPSAVKIEKFSGSRFELVEVKLQKDSAFDGLSLSEIRQKYKAKFLVCVVARDNEVFIPDGNFRVKSGDRIGLTATPAEIQKLFRSTSLSKKQAKNVMILGGGKIGFYLSKLLLSDSNNNVKIIEKDENICKELSESLPEAVIINGDGASKELLLEEGITTTDAFISLTGLDEQNILFSVYSSSLNVPKVITKVNNPSLASMAKNLGLDSIITPRQIISDVLVSYARALKNSLGSKVETLYNLFDGKAQALEFIVSGESKLIDIPIKDLRLKKNILIAGILRGRTPIIPSGDDHILEGDKVIIISSDTLLEDLDEILK